MTICYTVPEIWHVINVLAIFHFGPFFALFPSNSPKNQNFKKKWKKYLEISSFYTGVPKIMIICYTVTEIWCVTDVIVIFHFGLFFALLSPLPLTAQKIKISEKWKNLLEISSFCTCVPEIMIRWCMIPEIWCTTDRGTDRKSDIMRWVPHLKTFDFIICYLLSCIMTWILL